MKHSVLSRSLARILQSGLDPNTTDPRLFRQVRVLNSLMLTAMGLSIPLGIFWARLIEASYSIPYLIAFTTWGSLVYWLRRSLNITFVGRGAVFVLFALFTSSVVLLGGAESNLLAWYLLMPLAAAVCVGRGDLWFWGLVATVTPGLMHIFPQWTSIGPSPFSPEDTRLFSGIALSMAALNVSILTSIWISHHERLERRLDDSMVHLQKEADAHRLLSDTSMLAGAETKLENGAKKFLDNLYESQGVSQVCFWDTRANPEVSEPKYGLPDGASFPPSKLLKRALKSGERVASDKAEAGRYTAFYPIQDERKVVGAIEVATLDSQVTTHDGSWLIQQLALQLGHLAERERTRAIIQREARYDSLTSLNNRRAFEDLLENEIAEAESNEKSLALLFIDLNDFKRINDSLGHAAGDTVLQVIASRLQQAVRQLDQHPDQPGRASDSLSRMGGDEFTLVLKDLQSNEEASQVAQRILDSLSTPIQLEAQQFKVGASIGIAVFPEDAVQADALVRSADAAMYAAKRLGRSGYSRYRDADKAIDSLSFEADMRKALANDELEMHYQPVFCCQTGEQVGAEALIRWHHPERGWIPPGKFIPIAEDIGLMGELGRFQFDAVLNWYSKSRRLFPPDFRIALNLSPTQIQDSPFIAWLLNKLTDSDLPMENIELEITETALLEDTRETKTNLSALANLGVCMTLDDFGTGQSSLSLLKRFPIGRIKIDRSFVSGLPDKSDDVAIVNAVLSLAKSLDIPVVAEGVEEEQQRRFLIDQDCDDMQGYLLAKPMPGDRLTSAFEGRIQARA